MSAEKLRLVPPNLDGLPQYEAALAAGWSPNTERDVSAEELARLRHDPHAFLAEQTRQDGMILLGPRREVPRLPSRVYWLDDGSFCGVINLRFAPGSDELPDYCPGHIGYAVVPWKRRRGYATRALALLLPVAREVGLRRVRITCDDDNNASRQVIEKNGGIFVGCQKADGDKTKLVFTLEIAP